jgi:hypothetical protein
MERFLAMVIATIALVAASMLAVVPSPKNGLQQETAQPAPSAIKARDLADQTPQ